MSFKQIKRWTPLILLIGLIAAAWLTGLHETTSLSAIQAQKEELLTARENHSYLAGALFMAAYIVSVALSLPLATLLTLLGGFLFGKWLGTLIVVTSATIGAVIIFIVAKSALGVTLREKAGSLYKKIAANMEDNAVSYMLFMRLVPLFPFVLVNIVPALFNVRLRTFAWTTFIGIIPGSFAYVFFGEQLGEIDNPGDLLSPQLLAALALLGFFALLPALYKQIKARKKEAAS